MTREAKNALVHGVMLSVLCVISYWMITHILAQRKEPGLRVIDTLVGAGVGIIGALITSKPADRSRTIADLPRVQNGESGRQGAALNNEC